MEDKNNLFLKFALFLQEKLPNHFNGNLNNDQLTDYVSSFSPPNPNHNNLTNALSPICLRPEIRKKPDIQALIKNLTVADRSLNAAAGDGIVGLCENAAGITRSASVQLAQPLDTSALISASDLAEQGGFTEPGLSVAQDFSIFIALDMGEKYVGEFPELRLSPADFIKYTTSYMANYQDVGEFPEPLLPDIEDKVEDARDAARLQGDKSMGVSELQIYFVASRDDVDGVCYYAFVSPSGSVMSECKSGQVSECKTLVVQSKDLNWKDVPPSNCECIMSGNTIFLLGGFIRGVDRGRLVPEGCKDVYMFDTKAAATSSKWTKGPSMSVNRINHSAVCVDEKIYVFGGHEVDHFITTDSDGERKFEYTPWAEVYDIKVGKWSTIEFPPDLAEECTLNPHCCVINVGSKKKILVFNRLQCFAYDLNSSEWEENYIREKEIKRIDLVFSLQHVLQSGSMLFFITDYGWWVFSLLSMRMLENPVHGIFELEDELPLPKVRPCPAKVVSLGCSEGIHDLVVFYTAFDEDDDDSDMYIYVARIEVIEDLTKTSCAALLNSFGRFLIKEFECEYFHAKASISSALVFPEPPIQDGTPTMCIEDKVEDAHGVAHSLGDSLMGGSGLQIYFVAARVRVYDHDGYALINSSGSFMSECKAGKLGEFKTRILKAKDLNWEDVKPECCSWVVSGNTVFLLGGIIRDECLNSLGCRDLYMLDLEEDGATSRRWTRGPSMGIERINHVVVCVDAKIYVFGGCRYYRYMPWAEVYDTQEGKWSSIKVPLRLARDEPFYTRSCLVDIDSKKKILLFNCLKVFAFDLDTGEWEEDYIEEEKLNIIPILSFHQVVQSGNLLFFITGHGWYVYNLLSMEILYDSVCGLYEIEEELPSPVRDVKFGHRPAKVIGLGCSDGGIHDFVVFYEVCDDARYMYVARIAVTEDLTKSYYVASLNSFGRYLLEDFRCEHIHVVRCNI